MDKEREIEKMVNILCEMCDMWDNDEGYCTCGKDNTECWICGMVAEHMIDAGYRKLNDDDIVLTKAMQQGSCEGMDDRTLEFFAKHNAAVRKETAKEILQAMNEKMNMLTGCGVPYHVKQFMEEIAMQYGVEVDE